MPINLDYTLFIPIFIISIYAWIRFKKTISLLLSLILEFVITWLFIDATMGLKPPSAEPTELLKNYLGLAICVLISCLVIVGYIFVTELVYLIIMLYKKRGRSSINGVGSRQGKRG